MTSPHNSLLLTEPAASTPPTATARLASSLAVNLLASLSSKASSHSPIPGGEIAESTSGARVPEIEFLERRGRRARRCPSKFMAVLEALGPPRSGEEGGDIEKDVGEDVIVVVVVTGIARVGRLGTDSIESDVTCRDLAGGLPTVPIEDAGG